MTGYPPSPQPQLPPDQWRPSDDERGAIFTRLSEAVNEGRLGLTEYDARLRAAERADTMAALHQVVADLPAPPAPPEPVLVQIGELAVTPSFIHTPTGPIPTRGCQWYVQDRWLSEQKTPTWAIVLAIVGFFCLTIFSLLFLLAKESRYHGTVDIMVVNGARQYTARIPVRSHAQVHHLYAQVNYARSVGAG